MKRLMSWPFLLLAMWAVFWSLNAGDKVFNGDFRPMVAETADGETFDYRSVSKYAMVDNDGTEIGRIQGMHTSGLFGVNRDTKMGIFFSRIGLPYGASQVALYGTAVMELVVSLIFAALAMVFLINRKEDFGTTKGELRFERRADLAFMMSAMIFAMFTAGDILFGERMELWEHCCFLCTVLLTRTRFFAALLER